MARSWYGRSKSGYFSIRTVYGSTAFACFPESASFIAHFLKPAIGLRELALLAVLGWSLTRLVERAPRLRR